MRPLFSFSAFYFPFNLSWCAKVQINGQIYKQTRGSAVILPDKRNIYIVIRRIPTKTKTAMAHELTKKLFHMGKKKKEKQATIW